MDFSIEDIENLFINIPQNKWIANFLAPQEVERLASICFTVLRAKGSVNFADYATWSKNIELELVKEIKSSTEFFGVDDISSKIDYNELLKKLYELQGQK